LRARGGFEIDLNWNRNGSSHLIIRSKLGGKCRLRLNYRVLSPGEEMSSYKEVEGNLKEVEGESPNPFYHTPKLKVPLRSPDANVKGISRKEPAYLSSIRSQVKFTPSICSPCFDMVIDAHQHFWKFDPVRDSWIDDNMKILQRDFLPLELKTLLADNGVDGCIAVQADQSEQKLISC
jgi:hypothetical protein